ncbi:hypothetical protein, partial [Rhizobium sp. PEPV16]|uniref:hypothetical protein n=1 Tax=Rhizobium sp. PEPV16 TaxID=1820614 RepID=UPI001AEF92A4
CAVEIRPTGRKTLDLSNAVRRPEHMVSDSQGAAADPAHVALREKDHDDIRGRCRFEQERNALQ